MKTVKALSLPVTLAALVISGAALANPAGSDRAPNEKAGHQQTQHRPADAAPPEKTGSATTGVGVDVSGQSGIRSNTGNLSAPDANLKVGGAANAEGPKTGKGDSNTSSSR